MNEEMTRSELLEAADELRKRIAEMETWKASQASSEEALRESEERLHQVITNAPIVLWALDRDGVFTLSEGRGLEAMGLRPGEVVGRSLFDVYADHPQVLEDNRRALSGESLGSTVEVGGLAFACQLSPLRNPDGEVTGAIGVATDITERRQIEESLGEREAALEHQTRQQEGLLRISQAVQALSDPAGLEAVVKVCYEQLKLLGVTFDGLAIQRLIEEEARRFEAYEVQPSGRINRMEVTLPNLFPVWQSGEFLYRPDLEADPGGLTSSAWDVLCARYGVRIRCILNVPHSMGLISLLSTEANAFSDSDIGFVEQVGQMLSLGISRAGDLERLEARRKELEDGERVLRLQARQQEALLKISQAAQELTEPTGLEHVVRVCYDQLRDLGLDFQGLAIQRLVDDPAKVFEIYEFRSSDVFRRWRGPGPNVYRMWKAGQTDYRRDLDADMQGLPVDTLLAIRERYGASIRCILDVLHVRGTLALLSTRPCAFSDSEVSYVEQVAQVLSVGISRVEDLERLEARTYALSESEERFRKVFEEGPVGMVLVSPDLRLMRANEAFCRMMGYSELELGARVLAELTHPEDADRDSDRMQELLAGKIRVYEAEKRYVTGSGATLWADQVASVVRDGDGKIAYGLVIAQDITDRRRTEQELVRLERLRALGELAAGVSHNLNNMLTGILGPAQLIKHLSEDPMILREADIIISSSRRAADLVHRLNLSVRGKDDREVSPVSINALIQSVVDETRPRWKDEPESRGVSIDVVTDLKDVPPVRGTPSKLHDVLVNVLFNV